MAGESCISRPADLLGGFIAVRPDPRLALVMVGEQWAPEGQRIARHHHDVWEFYVQIAGTSSWQVGADRHALGAGGLMGVPPGIAHELRPQRRSHHYAFAAFRPEDSLRRLGLREFLPRKVHVAAAAPEVGAAISALVQEVVVERAARAAGLRLALDRVVLEIRRAFASLPGDPGGRRALPWHPGVEKVVALIRQEPGRPWSAADFGRAAGLSPGHLTALFRRALGMAPMQFVRRCRLERARDLLRSGSLSVTEIALTLGFASSQHFSSAYRRHAGIPPARERAAGNGRGGRPGP